MELTSRPFNSIFCKKESLIDVLELISEDEIILKYNYKKNKYQISFYKIKSKKYQYFTIEDFQSQFEPENEFKFKLYKSSLLNSLQNIKSERIELKYFQDVDNKPEPLLIESEIKTDELNQSAILLPMLD